MAGFIGYAQVDGEKKPRKTRRFSTEEKAQTALDDLVKKLQTGGYVVLNSCVLPQGTTPTFSANAEAGAAVIEENAATRFETTLPGGDQTGRVDALEVTALEQGKR